MRLLPLSLLPPLSPWRGAGGEASSLGEGLGVRLHPLLSFGYYYKKIALTQRKLPLYRGENRWVSAIISYETVYSGLNLSV